MHVYTPGPTLEHSHISKLWSLLGGSVCSSIYRMSVPFKTRWSNGCIVSLDVVSKFSLIFSHDRRKYEPYVNNLRQTTNFIVPWLGDGAHCSVSNVHHPRTSYPALHAEQPLLPHGVVGWLRILVVAWHFVGPRFETLALQSRVI